MFKSFDKSKKPNDNTKELYVDLFEIYSKDHESFSFVYGQITEGHLRFPFTKNFLCSMGIGNFFFFFLM